MPDNPVSKRLDLPSIVSLLVIVVAVFGALCILAATGVLDSDDAAAWVTSVSTAGLVIVAGGTLWPVTQAVCSSRSTPISEITVRRDAARPPGANTDHGVHSCSRE